jgi:hypothetical protein
VTAAQHLIPLLADEMAWTQIADVTKRQLELLPIVLSRSLSRTDKQLLVTRFSQIATVRCSVLLELGEPVSAAVESLEEGRAAILGGMIDSRVDISKFNCAFREDAKWFKDFRERMSVPILSETAEKGQPQRVQDLIDSENELNQLLLRVRGTPGFERFLLSPSEQDLLQAASEGPIIFITATQIRSDAIIVDNSKLVALPLPDFSYKLLNEWMSEDLTTWNGVREMSQKNKK